MVKADESVLFFNWCVGNRDLLRDGARMNAVGLWMTQSNPCFLRCESDLGKSFCFLLSLNCFKCRLLIKEYIRAGHARLITEKVTHVMLVDWLDHLIIK